VLIDELGSGTDPLEGAALGGAILDELTERRTLSVATTHLGALKELASEVKGVVNASLEFDAIALAPSYKLLKGIPGRSYGLSIARRLEFPSDVLARAEERVPRAERDVNALLADLERRTTELAEREQVASEVLENARARAARIAEREQNVRQREREVERAQRQDARRYLLEARSEVERTIQELRKASNDALEATIRDARQEIERLAANEQREVDRLDSEAAGARSSEDEAEEPGTSVNVGDVVAVGTLGGRVGRLLDIRDGQGIVAVGALKMTVPLDSLRRSAKQKTEPDVQVPIRGDIPEVRAPTEIDLRGMRVGEMDDILMQGLDAAVRADLKSLRIIHGKGTGALRDRVAEMLRKDTRVRNFRLGLWNEGGAGVTVAELE
jgi:DNA mismatch repair protein MutS2